MEYGLAAVGVAVRTTRAFVPTMEVFDAPAHRLHSAYVASETVAYKPPIFAPPLLLKAGPVFVLLLIQ